MLFFLPLTCCNLMLIDYQITKDGRKKQQQVNGYSPKFDENRWFTSLILGGYSPKKGAESVFFSLVGGYSPKSVAAAAEKCTKYPFLYGF